MDEYKSMLLKPRLSEKAYEQSQKNNRFVFVVPKTANKMSVAKAIIAQFDVGVEHVNMIKTKGKSKQTRYKRARPTNGHENDIKKAYVKLKAGQTIPIFQNEDDKAKENKRIKDK